MNKSFMFKKVSSLILLLCCISLNAHANYSQREDVQQFIKEMHTEHGFNVNALTSLMAHAKQQTTALEAIARPAEGVLTWKKYRKIFLTNSRINKGVQFWKDNAALLARAEKKYGVPAEFIVAIIGVETYYGTRAGNYKVLDALTTLGFDYPLENTTKKRQKAREKFFRNELKEFLLMTREEKLDPLSLKGSYAGAMGMPQFIPSSFRHYAVDFDGNGVRDFWTSSADPIGSVANYFKKHGWKKGYAVVSKASVTKGAVKMASKKMKPHKSVKNYKAMGVKPMDNLPDQALSTLLELDGENGKEYWLALNNFYVITRYNHSSLYAMAVYQLSQIVAEKYHAK